MELGFFTSNLQSQARRETLQGRSFLVADATILREGILNGSEGSLFYPKNEIQRNPQDWNGMPILRNHPDKDGGVPSGRTPKVFDKQGMGWVFDAKITDEDTGRLGVELWFDEERTKNLDPDLFGRIERGEKIELSTGLYTDNEPAQNGASYNGDTYAYTAKNYRPDHLAILPDQIGACPVREGGCGVWNEKTVEFDAVNSAGEPFVPKPTYTVLKLKTNCEATNKSGPCKAGAKMKQTLKLQSAMGIKFGSAEHDAAKAAHVAGISAKGPLKPKKPRIKRNMLVKRRARVTNETSYDELREILTRLLQERYGQEPFYGGLSHGSPLVWVQDVFQDHVVYQYGDKSYSLGYSVDLDSGKASLSEEAPVKVKRATVYKPVSNCGQDMECDGCKAKRMKNKKGAGIMADKKVYEKPMARNLDTAAKGSDIAEATVRGVKRRKKRQTVNQSTSKSVATGKKEGSMTKKQNIDWLVANVDCWKGEKAQVVLNEMADAEIEKLRINQQRLSVVENALANPVQVGEAQLQLSLNDDGELEAEVLNDADDGEDEDEDEDEDEEDDEEFETETVEVQNAFPDFLKKKIEKDEDDDEKDKKKEKMKENRGKPKSARQWLNDAPEPIRSAVVNAMKIERTAKEECVTKLTANLDETKRGDHAKFLMAKPLGELKQLMELMPVTNERKEVDDVTAILGEYAGAATLPIRPLKSNAETPKAEPLGVPTFNYAANSGKSA